jgi:hypothetical protein
MSKFCIELARPSDDAALRELAAAQPMGGDIRVAVRREPSFFHGVGIQGRFNQVGVVRDGPGGRVVGCATRSVRPAYLNGQRADLGYIGGLRLDPMYRGGTLLARGYRAFREHHQDGRARLYATTIIEPNQAARELLTSRRAGLPCYEDWGRYYTLAIGTSRAKRALRDAPPIERGSANRLEEIADHLRRNGRQKQFYPCYEGEEFARGEFARRGFCAEDFFLAVRSGRVVGAAAIWDQSSFKQTIVAVYRGKMRVLRPLYNVAAALGGWPRLPPAGTQLNQCYASFIAADGNDPATFRALLREIHNEAARRGYAYLLVGLHEQDPLLAVASEYLHFSYPSRLYVVYWDDGADACRALDRRVPYLELALL